MHRNTYFVIIFVIFTYSRTLYASSETIADSWIILTSQFKKYLNNCSRHDKYFKSWNCIKNSSYKIFDQITNCNTIPIAESMTLKRYDNKFRFLQNDEIILKNNMSWSQTILNKFLKTLHTHTLEIDLSPMRDSPRRRRHHNQMLPMMVFGVTAFGMVVIPMGFQFLAVLSGKALLLAKMALWLASFNGLKRVASSGVHYGLYHTPQGNNAGWYDRGPDIGPR